MCCLRISFFLFDGLPHDAMVRIFILIISIRHSNTLRLIKYTPIASIVRLITASFIYYVSTYFILQYTGSNTNASLLLPVWIFIATVSLPIHTSLTNKFPDIHQGIGSHLPDHARTSEHKTTKRSFITSLRRCFVSYHVFLDSVSSHPALFWGLTMSSARRRGVWFTLGLIFQIGHDWTDWFLKINGTNLGDFII